MAVSDDDKKQKQKKKKKKKQKQKQKQQQHQQHHLISNRREMTSAEALISLERAGQWEAALQILKKMGDLSLQASIISYNTTANACAKLGHWQTALHLTVLMSKRSLSPDQFSYNAVITGCARSAQWQSALSILTTMQTVRLEGDVFSWSSALNSCRRGGTWQLTVSLMEEMAVQSVKRDDVSWGFVLSSCELASAWQAALGLLESMISSQITPNGMHAGAVIGSLKRRSQSNKDDESFKVLEKLRKLWLEHLSPVRKGVGNEMIGDGSRSASSSGYYNSSSQAGSCKAATKVAEVGTASVLLEQEQQTNRDATSQKFTLVSSQHILGESEGVLALNKPTGVSTEDFLASLGQDGTKVVDPFHLVSRLDLPTSGVLPVALGSSKSPQSYWLEA